MFDYCLFDLDGTLTDPREGITRSVQYALRYFGIEEPDLKKLEPFIGPPLKASFKEFYGLNEQQARKAMDVYRERFAPIGVLENKIFPGTESLLKKAKDKGSELDGTRDAKEEVVEEALRQLGILDMEQDKRRERCAMIGDRKFDIYGAKAHGLTGVGVRFGFAGEGELEEAGADYIAENMEELAVFLTC